MQRWLEASQPRRTCTVPHTCVRAPPHLLTPQPFALACAPPIADDDMRVPGHTVRGVEEDDDDEDADEEHPLNRLASGAMEKGQELLSKVCWGGV